MRIIYKFIFAGSGASGHAIPVILCLVKIIGKFIENLFTNSNIAYIMFYVRPNRQNASMAQLVERLIRNQ